MCLTCLHNFLISTTLRGLREGLYLSSMFHHLLAYVILDFLSKLFRLNCSIEKPCASSDMTGHLFQEIIRSFWSYLIRYIVIL